MNLFISLFGLLLCGLSCESVKTLGKEQKHLINLNILLLFPAIATTTKYNMHCHVRLNSEIFIKILVEIKFFAELCEAENEEL